ncbi:MAG: hypothetical protein PHS34_08550 [Candidatus Omnitrophica bacterium]|nr:hypothetical protein [Candidatus Omnitrophota bacterium]MDD5551295.1 hypothetical protein [Candidatus Omnitrophota bacterium]
MGKLVYGGSTYAEEIKPLRRYVRIINILDKIRKVVKVDDRRVDTEEKWVKTKTPKRFDDPHLIAIITISECMLIGTKDIAALPYLVDRKYYRGKIKSPKFYTGYRHRGLLDKRNVPTKYRYQIKYGKRLTRKNIEDEIKDCLP